MWIISSDHRKLFVSPCSNILIVGSLLEHNTTENIFKKSKGTLMWLFWAHQIVTIICTLENHKIPIQGRTLKSLLKEPSMRNADITRTHQYRATFE